MAPNSRNFRLYLFFSEHGWTEKSSSSSSKLQSNFCELCAQNLISAQPNVQEQFAKAQVGEEDTGTTDEDLSRIR